MQTLTHTPPPQHWAGALWVTVVKCSLSKLNMINLGEIYNRMGSQLYVGKQAY